MAISYSLVKRHEHPSSKESITRYYAQAHSERKIDFDTICEEISSNCKIKKRQVQSILSAVVSSMVDHLSEGDIVFLDGFGHFAPLLINAKPFKNEKGEKIIPAPEKREDFFPEKNIEQVMIHFLPDGLLKEMCKTATFREIDGGSSLDN